MSSFGAALLAAAGVYAAALGAMYLFQRRLMYHPGAAPGLPKDWGLEGARAVAVSTEDGLALTSWYLPPPDGGKTAVVFHGNAGNIADRADKARDLAALGLGVLLAEYRGFGGNPGRPTEAGIYADARGHLDWLRGQGQGPRDWLVYGESLGTAPAVQMALELARAGTPAAGLVLEAPFTSMAKAAQHHYPWIPAAALTRDRYESDTKIGAIGTALLILHGSADRTVPQAMGKRLFELAGNPKQGAWFEGGGHVNLYEFGAADAVRDFLRSLDRSR